MLQDETTSKLSQLKSKYLEILGSLLKNRGKIFYEKLKSNHVENDVIRKTSQRYIQRLFSNDEEKGKNDVFSRQSEGNPTSEEISVEKRGWACMRRCLQQGLHPAMCHSLC